MPCLDWWEIQCLDTTHICYPIVALNLAAAWLSPRCFVYETIICQREYLAQPILFRSVRLTRAEYAYIAVDLWERVILVVGPLCAVEEQSSSFQTALFFPGALLVTPCCTSRSISNLTWLCCMHPWDQLPQPQFVLSSGILCAHHMDYFAWFSWSVVFKEVLAGSKIPGGGWKRQTLPIATLSHQNDFCIKMRLMRVILMFY